MYSYVLYQTAGPVLQHGQFCTVLYSWLPLPYEQLCTGLLDDAAFWQCVTKMQLFLDILVTLERTCRSNKLQNNRVLLSMRSLVFIWRYYRSLWISPVHYYVNAVVTLVMPRHHNVIRNTLTMCSRVKWALCQITPPTAYYK